MLGLAAKDAEGFDGDGSSEASRYQCCRTAPATFNFLGRRDVLAGQAAEPADSRVPAVGWEQACVEQGVLRAAMGRACGWDAFGEDFGHMCGSRHLCPVLS